MTAVEICLIVIGVITLIGSYVFAPKFDKGQIQNGMKIDKVTDDLMKDKINKAVDESINNTIDEKVEKTEIKLEKLSNQKIMALSEYQEGVMAEINKTHEEIMFLYGMLNDKEKDIKNTVRDIELVKKSVKKMQIHSPNEEKLEEKSSQSANSFVYQNLESGSENNSSKEDVTQFKIKANKPDSKMNNSDKVNKKEEQTKDEQNRNNNQKILDLLNAGKSNIEIAKELNLGMGEVRLVIDLYKNRKKNSK